MRNERAEFNSSNAFQVPSFLSNTVYCTICLSEVTSRRRSLLSTRIFFYASPLCTRDSTTDTAGRHSRLYGV